MSNTYDATLVQEILEEAVITQLGTVLAPVDSFVHEVSATPLVPRSTHNVECVISGSTVLTNPDNFEQGDSVVENRPVTVNHLSKPFHATQQEMNLGHRARNLFTKNLEEMADEIQDVIFAPMTEANYGAAVLDKTAATFAPGTDLPTVWAAAKNFRRKNLFLDGSFYAKCLPTDHTSFRPEEMGAYGFDRLYLNNRWDGAGSDVIGCVADRNAVVIKSGTPYLSPKLEEVLDVITVTLENGISVQLYNWVSTVSRAEWWSLDTVIGAGVGDKAALKLIEGGTD